MGWANPTYASLLEADYMGNDTLLGTIPKVAIDIEGFVAGIYEAEMGLINTMRGETHTFSEMTEYPKRGGTRGQRRYGC